MRAISWFCTCYVKNHTTLIEPHSLAHKFLCPITIQVTAASGIYVKYLSILFLFQVLRPYSNLANLKIWDYYVTEDLAHGPSYDIEVVAKELRLNEDVDITTGLPPQKRKIVNGCYDNVPLQEPDIYSWQLQVGILRVQ